jgi:hypothetical protein
MRTLGLVLLAVAAPALAAAPAKDAAPKTAAAATQKAGAPAARPPRGWAVVDAKDGGFTAWFPGKPETFSGRKAGVGFVGYGYDTKAEPRRTYAVLVLGGSDAAALMADQLVAEVFAGGAKPTSDAPATVDGHAAHAVVLKSDESVIALRRFTAFGREHVALVRVPAAAEVPADAATFFGSLHPREAAALPAAPAVAKLAPAKASEGFAERVLVDGGVALAFPAEPVRETDPEGKVTTWTVEGASGRCTFSLTTLAFQAADGLSDEALGLFAMRVADAYGEAVVSNAPATVGGLPARAFEVATGDERLQVRVVRVGNRLHHLLVSAKGATPSEADLAVFFGSFRTLP